MQAQKLWGEVSVWSQKTFGSDQERGPIGPLKHLKLEAEEAIQSNVRDEYADCLILIFDAARRSGLTYDNFMTVALEKLRVCKTRTYPKPASDEPGHHDE